MDDPVDPGRFVMRRRTPEEAQAYMLTKYGELLDKARQARQQVAEEIAVEIHRQVAQLVQVVEIRCAAGGRRTTDVEAARLKAYRHAAKIARRIGDRPAKPTPDTWSRP